ncbi:MAG TPA: RNA polymerase sigma factor [Candidatus Kapabacteria bacterium]|nr:RNA polymerase sigma factor [Candidatus Kapabacteria bacterium]
MEIRALFEQFLAGDNAAFAELHRELNPRLSAYCYKLAPEHSEDIVQEMWERVIAMRSKASRQTPIDSPLAFLFRMLKNIAIDHFRRSKETRALTEEDSDRTAPTVTDLEALILEAFEKLSFDDREVLVLNIYSGYKFGEIAEMQGKSVDAVWAQASRARARLRAIVIEDAKEAGISLPAMKQKAKIGDHQKETIA